MIGSVVWANDNEIVFYIFKDEIMLCSYKVMCYCFGMLVEEDVEIYSEDDVIFLVFVYKIKFDKYIVVGFYVMLSQEYWVLNVDNLQGEFWIIQFWECGLEYSIVYFGDYFYIWINLDV